MTKQRNAAESDKKTREKKKPAELKRDESVDNGCRCKEVAKKSLPEMITLMIGDLAFWKK